MELRVRRGDTDFCAELRQRRNPGAGIHGREGERDAADLREQSGEGDFHGERRGPYDVARGGAAAEDGLGRAADSAAGAGWRGRGGRRNEWGGGPGDEATGGCV